jgi:hypothetical protein
MNIKENNEIVKRYALSLLKETYDPSELRGPVIVITDKAKNDKWMENDEKTPRNWAKKMRNFDKAVDFVLSSPNPENMEIEDSMGQVWGMLDGKLQVVFT